MSQIPDQGYNILTTTITRTKWCRKNNAWKTFRTVFVEVLLNHDRFLGFSFFETAFGYNRISNIKLLEATNLGYGDMTCCTNEIISWYRENAYGHSELIEEF